jgi:DNA (cytosine-5)-methyltransferase 1
MPDTIEPEEIVAVADVEEILRQKAERIREGGSIRVLDLFSGCGGLSLGFDAAGFSISAAVEMDPQAAATHALNFSHENAAVGCARDIQQTDPDALAAELGMAGYTAENIDVIIGGPPCQAFTRIGRAKLREVKNDRNAFLNDARSQLYRRYLDYVKAFRPLAILMENVPDILNYGGVNIADAVCDDLSELGYNCSYTLLNTVYYGVPQMRERMFLIGLHESVDAEIVFPLPTHMGDLPRGYHGSRNVALQTILRQDEHRYFRQPPVAGEEDLLPAVTAATALSDLPELRDHLEGKAKRGMRDTSAVMAYRTAAQNAFQLMMRQWDGFATDNDVKSNVIRYLPRDFPIFRAMKPGDQYPQALQIARQLYEQKIECLNAENTSADRSPDVYENLRKKTIPPYSDGKFPNKWRKMEADKPSRTLMAHLGKDSYSHIHYDSAQSRTISVREAARLQSFPDGFEFSGAMNAAFRQIGNAVPPLMARRLAECIHGMLTGI